MDIIINNIYILFIYLRRRRDIVTGGYHVGGPVGHALVLGQ